MVVFLRCRYQRRISVSRTILAKDHAKRSRLLVRCAPALCRHPAPIPPGFPRESTPISLGWRLLASQPSRRITRAKQASTPAFQSVPILHDDEEVVFAATTTSFLHRILPCARGEAYCPTWATDRSKWGTTTTVVVRGRIYPAFPDVPPLTAILSHLSDCFVKLIIMVDAFVGLYDPVILQG